MDNLQEKYQVFPPLTDEEYQSLKNDIAKQGILVPIELDENGNILDGHHRVRAWEELRANGVNVPQYSVFTRSGFSEIEKLNHIRSLNLLRRHLTIEQQKPHWEEMRKTGMTYQAIADASGVSKKTVQNAVSENSPTQPDKVIGKDGKAYPPRKPRQPKTTFTKSSNIKIDNKRHDKERKTPVVTGQYDVEIRPGDFREVLQDISPQSVKLILTDPPYGKKDLSLWNDLGSFAARVLRPDGALIAYSGQLYLPEVINSLLKHLDWWWLCGLAHAGSGNLTPLGQPVRKVINQFKPVPIFVRKGGGIETVFRDLVDGTGKGKEKHNWGQPVLEAEIILKTFCQEGDLIVDPFSGSGSIGKAAVDLGLQFIGAEILFDGQN